MAQTFTPGPWQPRDGETAEGRLTIIANIDGEYFPDRAAPHMTHDTICVCEDEYGESLENAEANARLIALAPQLLSELKDLRQRFRRALILTGTDAEFADIAVSKADALIAKAEAAA